jgi:hypothetical protein
MIIRVPKRLLVAIVFFPVFRLFQNAFNRLVPKFQSVEKLYSEVAIKKNDEVIYDYFVNIFVNTHAL